MKIRLQFYLEWVLLFLKVCVSVCTFTFSRNPLCRCTSTVSPLWKPHTGTISNISAKSYNSPLPFHLSQRLPPTPTPTQSPWSIVAACEAVRAECTVESLLGCLCSSSRLSSIIHRAVWQLTAPPGLCLLLPISDWLCMHNQSSSERIQKGNPIVLHPAATKGASWWDTENVHVCLT